MKIETLRTADLIPYARNSRTHSDEQVAQIAGSIREFGWTNPVLIDTNGTIVAGHGRVMAARKLGMESVPCIRLGHLTPAQVRAYVIADNKLALNAGWDEEMLKSELAALGDEGFDVGLTGFSEDELADLLSVSTVEGNTDPDDVPEAPAQPVSVLGDVWVLDGRHRITCGDCTQKEVVERVLSGVQPHLMVTDPPYGVEYDPGWRNSAIDGSKTKRTGKVLNDDRSDWREAWALFPGDVGYVWHAPGPLQVSVHESLIASGFEPRQHIVWVKDRLVLGRGHYHYQHEPCWYAVRKNGTGHWGGGRKQTSVWQIANKNQDAKTTHGTQKPVECMRRPIENNSSPGQAVYEPFSGSGTTIIACEQSGRIAYAVELNPAYVDVAVDRWQKFTGKEAVNELTGRTFNETKSKMEGQPKEC